MRRVMGVVAALLLVAGLVVASEAKEVSGTVKSVAGSTIVVTDKAAKDWTFAIDSKDTLIMAKGGRHKLEKLKADGKAPLLTDFISEKQQVLVKYTEKEGKLTASEVRVTK
jgi:hypothetical protein